MSKLIAIVLIVVGVFLIIWGYNESQTLGSQLNRMFSGAETERTLIFYIGGGISLVLGIIGIAKG